MKWQFVGMLDATYCIKTMHHHLSTGESDINEYGGGFAAFFEPFIESVFPFVKPLANSLIYEGLSVDEDDTLKPTERIKNPKYRTPLKKYPIGRMGTNPTSLSSLKRRTRSPSPILQSRSSMRRRRSSAKPKRMKWKLDDTEANPSSLQ